MKGKIYACFMVFFLYHNNSIIVDCGEEDGGLKSLNIETLGGMVSNFMSESGNLMRMAGTDSENGDTQIESFLTGLTSALKTALNTASTSEFARENFYVPMYEKIGALKDSMGVVSNFSSVISQTFQFIQSIQIPLERFAAERFANKNDTDEDIRLLTRLEGHPIAKGVLRSFAKCEPERKMAEAAVLLDAYYNDFKELNTVLKESVANNTFAESLLINFDVLSSGLSQVASRYVATISRYLLYKDRFGKNKSALLFVTKAVLPRLLRLYAIELNILETLWSAAEAMQNTSALLSEDYLSPDSGNLDALAGEELFINILKTPNPKPHVLIRRWCRRVLARVKNQVDDLNAISQATLSCTSLEFQVQYAKAIKQLNDGGKPAIVFKELREETSCIATGTPYKPKEVTSKDSETADPIVDDRQRLLDLLAGPK